MSPSTSTRTAYYTEDNYAFRDLIEVECRYRPKKMLIRDARIGDFVVNPVGQIHLGYPPRKRPRDHRPGSPALPVVQSNPHVQLRPDAVRPRYLAGRQHAVRFIRGDQRHANGPRLEARRALHRGRAGRRREARPPPATPEGFVFAPDGKSLYGTSYYTGVSNIFRFDIASQKFDAVSNASTGFFRPIPQPDGSLIAYEYSGKGLQPVRLVPKVQQDLGTIEFLGTKVVNDRPELKAWGVGSPAKVPLDSLIIARGKYRGEDRMKMAACSRSSRATRARCHPVTSSIGKTAEFNQLNASFSISPINQLETKNRFHARLQYKTLNWDLQYRHNGADFYDIFGPVSAAAAAMPSSSNTTVPRSTTRPANSTFLLPARPISTLRPCRAPRIFRVRRTSGP